MNWSVLIPLLLGTWNLYLAFTPPHNVITFMNVFSSGFCFGISVAMLIDNARYS